MLNDKPSILYRYEDHWGIVKLEEFHVIRHTPCGCWINRSYWKKPKFVLFNTHKKFAARTIEEAKKSFFERKRMQLKILARQRECIEIAVQALKDDRLGDSTHLVEY